MADLLLELFSEEIPARMQLGAAEQLRARMEAALKEARLDYAELKTYVSPRHLAVAVNGLPVQQPDRTVERKGPKIGAPDAAVKGFLSSTGLTMEQLEVRKAGKDDCYFAVIQETGQQTADALKPIIEKILNDFHWPKSQRWGDHAMHWVRPLKAILCLLDETVIPVEFGHLSANDVTYGHRFLAPDAIALTHPSYYIRKLEDAKVLVDYDQREALIESTLKSKALENGLELVEDNALLEEVTGLVEWPVVMIGEFDASYLELPPEVLISEMRHHQKYFALRQQGSGNRQQEEKKSDARCLMPDALSNRFLIVSNMITNDGGKAVVNGNGRVLRARLEDGKFYWDQDRNKKLDDMAKATAGMIFHAALGSVAEKAARIEGLAGKLAAFCHPERSEGSRAMEGDPSALPQDDGKLAKRAASLCKADLVSGMVGEFPELQGIMGRYYAQAQKEDAGVADAIRDHYKPAGASDDVPTAPVSVTVAIADRIDTLVGMFAIGDKPTGSKDPYALRRAALGIIRIILENHLRIPLKGLIADAAAQYPAGVFKASKDEMAQQLLEFFGDRLKVMLKDQGVRHDLIQAVFAEGEDDLVAITAKARALGDFLGSEDGANLLSAYRRANNILAAEEKKDGKTYKAVPEDALFEIDAERQLFAALEKIKKPCEGALKAEKYAAAMQELASLRKPVDAYFDAVLVNAPDAKVRVNRLNTLNEIRQRMDAVVAFSMIEGG